MTCNCILICIFGMATAAFSSPFFDLENVKTNTFVVSENILKPRWKRTAIMADKDNRPLDPTGQLVAVSDLAALDVTASRAGEIGDAALSAMTNSVNALVAVTNQVPASAQHFAISLPELGSGNLQSMVVGEGMVGSNDWQMIRFNQTLNVPPSRVIVYSYPGGTATVEARWDAPWDPSATDHRCTFPRPKLLDKPFTLRSKRMDLFGGPKGLSFGNALIKVDGSFTFTGSITNDVTGAVLNFENGVLKK